MLADRRFESRFMKFFPAEFDVAPMSLSGMCRFRALGGALEVEIVEVESLSRGVVYLRNDAALILFIPRGNYGFWLRSLDDGDGRLDITVMGLEERIKFLLTKAFNLLHRGPFFAAQAVMGFLRRRGKVRAAQVVTSQPMAATPVISSRKVETPIPVSDREAVSIIIPTKVHAALLRQCVLSLELLRNVTTELIIIDNGANSPHMLQLLEELRTRPDTRVLRLDVPFNFSRLCNAGGGLAKHPYLLFLNDDVEALDGDWLSHMLGFATRPDVGVVGAQLLYPSGHLQHAGIASNLVPGPGHPFRLAPPEVCENHPLISKAGEVDAVTGACLLVRKDLFNDLTGFNEVDFAVSLNDVDLCLRARERDLKVIYAPQARLLHKEGQSRRDDDHPGERARRQSELAAFFRRHSVAARRSVYYPATLRRDGDGAIEI